MFLKQAQKFIRTKSYNRQYINKKIVIITFNNLKLHLIEEEDK